MVESLAALERIACPCAGDVHRLVVRARRPIIIAGLAKDWRAAQRWTPEWFSRTFANVTVEPEMWNPGRAGLPVERLEHVRRRRMTMAELVACIGEGDATGERPYLAQYPLLRSMPGLGEDLPSVDALMGLSAFPEAVRSRLRWEPTLWMGPAGTVSPLHFDVADNFLVQLHGSKRVAVLAPGQSERLYYGRASDPGLAHFSPVDLERPDLGRFPRARDAVGAVGQLEPGDVLFIPAGHWHHVRSLSPSVSLNFWWWNAHGAARFARHTRVALACATRRSISRWSARLRSFPARS
jgi:lysine-specific demethylase 8